jgi:tRNA A37 N6-isopentenylltransferase MiaA
MIVGGTGLYIDSVYRNLSMPDVIADRDLRNQWEAEELVQP